MSSGCGDVLTLEDLKTAKKHQLFEAEVITGKSGGVADGADIDYATNQVTGQVQKTLPAVLRDAGFRPAPFTFDTGGTLGVDDTDLAVLWPGPSGDGQYYVWHGAYPKTIPAASTPASTGGISSTAWVPFGDITLRGELAAAGGADIIGKAGGGTVQDGLDGLNSDVAAIEATLADSGKTTSIAHLGESANLTRRFIKAHRVTNKTVPQDPTKRYDHFGTMDIKPDGTLYQTFRRGVNHTDAGVVMYSELLQTGAWSTPVQIVAQSGVDCRGSAGGTAPDGAMYAAGAYATPTTSTPFTGAFVYRSRDYGATWQQVANIANPDAGTNAFIIPYGKIAAVGNKLVIPAYRRDNSFNPTLTFLQSSDNGTTWTVGTTISTGTDYNEASILDMGDGIVLCVARTGDGTVQPDGSRRLRQFISANGGATWSDQGWVIGPDAAEEIGWQLVSPSLSLVYSPSGTPHVLLMYTARVGGVRYRTCPVTTLTAGSANWSVFWNGRTIASEFESGYQSQVVVGNSVFVNYYATTTTDSVSVATTFQFPLGDLPDFDSGWLAVSALVNVTSNHGLLAVPRRTIVLFSTDNIGKTAVYPADNALYYNGSTTVGAGIAWQVNQSGYTLRPGTYMMYQGVFGTGGTNPTSGFARILAWK